MEVNKIKTRLILLFTALLLLTILSKSDTIPATFTSNFGSTYQTAVNINMGPTNLNVVLASNGNPVSNNDLVCTGNTFTISASNYSTFTPTYNAVECAFATCNRDTTTALSAFPQPIMWMSTANFLATQASYSSKGSGCKDYGGAAQQLNSNPLAPYVVNANYYTETSLKGSGRTYLGLFCYGGMSYSDNGNPIGSTFTVTTTGNHLFSANLFTSGCGVLARSYDSIYKDVYDCFYSSPTTTNAQVSESLNLIVTNGPVFSIVGSPVFDFAPGSTSIITVPIQNTGVMNGTINNVVMDQGFTVNSFNPITINAGQTGNLVLNVTVPAIPGNYNPNMILTYSSNTPVVGSCGSGTQTLSITTAVACPTATIILNGAPSTFNSQPGNSAIITLPVQNTGAANGTITSVSMDQGFTVNSFSPAALTSGQTTNLTLNVTLPLVPGTYNNINVNVSYNVPLVASCGTTGSGILLVSGVVSCSTANLISNYTNQNFTVTPGGSITLDIPIQNTGVANSTITSISVNQGFTVAGFNPTDINAGQATTLELTISAPFSIGPRSPVITINYTSNSGFGGCGNGATSLSLFGPLINVTPTNPISPVIYAVPSGILIDSGHWYPSKSVNITGEIIRPEDNLYEATTSNLTIYVVDPSTGSNTNEVASFVDISAPGFVKNGVLVSQNVSLLFDVSTAPMFATTYEGYLFPLTSSVYRVVLSTYDPIKQNIQTANAYFVIYQLFCTQKA